VIAKEDLLKQLGAKVRDIRKEKGISQSELAYSIGKDQQSIQRLEAGRINPSFYYLHQIAEGLKVDLQILIEIKQS
jgi:transcriptional regulator with XRE-family HTH domain